MSHVWIKPVFGVGNQVRLKLLYFNIGGAINKSCSYMLTSTILKVDVVCDIAMTSMPNVLITELRDRLYNQYIDNRCCKSFFIYPTGQIRVCKIRFVSTGGNAENLVYYARK